MRIAAVAIALMLGACGDAAPEPTPTPEPTGTFVASPGEPASLALRPDGLSLLAVGSTRGEAIVFGAARTAVETAAGSAFPDITIKREANAECPAGAMEFASFGALTLNFQDGKFIGWFARDGVETATIDGIRPGITRAELESERSVTLDTQTTLDGMFTYFLPDGTAIGGVLDGDGAGAKVTALHAGVNCFFS